MKSPRFHIGSAAVLGTAASALVLLSGPTFAQTGQARALEEIVVTARKAEESLQQAPISVTAFTAEAIASQGIVDVDALSRLTPGLSFSQAFGRSTDRPVIRGQSNVLARVQFGVESGTAYFLDGVYYNGDIQSLDFNSLQRVEVIKGPQSALYGRNTYAGAINFITQDPTNEFQGAVKALGARHDEYEFAGSIAGPIVQDKLYFRAGGRYFEYAGEHVNTLTDRLVGSERTVSLNGALIWELTNDFSARLSMLYSKDRDGPLPLFLTGSEANNCAPGWRSGAFRRQLAFLPVTPFINSDNENQYFCGALQPGVVALNTEPLNLPAPTGMTGAGPFPIFGTIAPIGERDGTAFDGIFKEEIFNSLILDWDIGGTGWVATSQTGRRTMNRRFGTDSDHSDAFAIGAVFAPFPSPTANIVGYAPGEPLFANTTFSETLEWSQEVRLASPQDRQLRFLTGVFYYDFNSPATNLTFNDPVRGEIGTTTGRNTDIIRNRAVFGLVAYDINDQWTITGELRYQKETKKRIEDRRTPPAAGGQVFESFLGAADFTSTTPRLTVDYQMNDEVMLFFTYAKGAKPGGINGSLGTGIGIPTYDQERSDNFELGMKSYWFDRRLRANVSLYLIDAKDVQLTTAIPDPGGSAINSVATNQGETETLGLELELQALLTDNLTVSFGYALADSEFTKGCDDFQYTLNTGGLLIPGGFDGPECSIKGNQTPLGSKHQANLSLDYRIQLAGGLEFFAVPSVTYESKKFIQVHNLAYAPAATITNLRIGLRSDDGWQVTAFARNLFDEDAIPLATRWFDLRNGFSTTADVPAAQLASQGCNINSGSCIDAGLPRSFFGALRKGRTYGLEFRYNF